MAARFHSTLSPGVADDRKGSTGIMYAMLRGKVCDFVSFFGKSLCVRAKKLTEGEKNYEKDFYHPDVYRHGGMLHADGGHGGRRAYCHDR